MLRLTRPSPIFGIGLCSACALLTSVLLSRLASSCLQPRAQLPCVAGRINRERRRRDSSAVESRRRRHIPCSRSMLIQWRRTSRRTRSGIALEAGHRSLRRRSVGQRSPRRPRAPAPPPHGMLLLRTVPRARLIAPDRRSRATPANARGRIELSVALVNRGHLCVDRPVCQAQALRAPRCLTRPLGVRSRPARRRTGSGTSPRGLRRSPGKRDRQRPTVRRSANRRCSDPAGPPSTSAYQLVDERLASSAPRVGP